jgi:hypothetical protein
MRSSVERFVHSENIRRFSEIYEREPAQGRQDVLRRMILDEESRYGSQLAQLEVVNERIASNNKRIEQQQDLISHLENSGTNAEQQKRILQNLLELRRLYSDYGRMLLDSLQRCHP